MGLALRHAITSRAPRLLLQPDEAAHPILRGVKDVWVQSGGYTADPIEGSHILAMGQILNGMTPDSPPATDKKEQPVAWYRTYTGASGKSGRVFTTTHGASEDLLNDGFRRMIVNACLWACRPREQHSARRRHQLRRPVPPVDVCIRRLRQGR